MGSVLSVIPEVLTVSISEIHTEPTWGTTAKHMLRSHWAAQAYPSTVELLGITGNRGSIFLFIWIY